MYDILKERYPLHEPAIDRMCATAFTQKDFEAIASLITTIYEKAFTEAIKQQKDALAAHGLKVNVSVTANKEDGPKIFT